MQAEPNPLAGYLGQEAALQTADSVTLKVSSWSHHLRSSPVHDVSDMTYMTLSDIGACPQSWRIHGRVIMEDFLEVVPLAEA